MLVLYTDIIAAVFLNLDIFEANIRFRRKDESDFVNDFGRVTQTEIICTVLLN